MIKRLRCCNCHKLVKYKEYLYLDMMNTVLHQFVIPLSLISKIKVNLTT